MKTKGRNFSTAMAFFLFTVIFCGIELMAQPLYAGSNSGEPISGTDIAILSVRLTPDVVFAGERLRAEVTLKIKEGWYVYALKRVDEDAPPPSSVSFFSKQLEPDGLPYENPPMEKYEKAIDLKLLFHTHTAHFVQHFLIPENSIAGTYSLGYTIKFQLCSKALCLPAELRKGTVRYVIQAGKPRVEHQSIQRPVFKRSVDQPLKEYKEKGFWSFIGLAALMGAVSLLTPCVFPMIPLTLSYFSRSSDYNQKKIIQKALTFSGGIVFTYSGGGLLMAILFGAASIRILAANPFVNLGLAVLFITFGISLMGFFEFRLSGGLVNYVDRQSRRLGGHLGIFLMGVAFTLTAFTCTVQFIGTLLVAAAHGDWQWPLIGMSVFSTVFSIPFFILAAVPGWLSVTQKFSGVMLRQVRQLLGLLSLLISIKFISNADLVWQLEILSRTTVLWGWCTILLVGGVYIFFLEKTESGIQPFKQISLWIIAGLILISWYGAQGNSLGKHIDSILPPIELRVDSENTFVPESEFHSVIPFKSLDEARGDASQRNKYIFVEFTGKTCVNCRWMERNMFRRNRVFKTLNRKFVWLKLYTDSGPQAKENLKYQIDTFGTVALPLYVLMDTNGNVIKQLSGIVYKPKTFLDFLVVE